MEAIRIIATFTAIAPEHRERFKATVLELTELVASEEGTLEYRTPLPMRRSAS